MFFNGYMFFKYLGFSTQKNILWYYSMIAVLQMTKEKFKFLWGYFWIPYFLLLLMFLPVCSYIAENMSCVCSALVQQLFDFWSLRVLAWYYSV